MRVESPLVREFTIPSLGWTVRDQRLVADPGNGVELRTQNLYAFFKSIPRFRHVELCDMDDGIQKEISRRWRRERAKNKRLTWEEFEDAGHTMVHSGCADPRLWQFNFLIYDANYECIGGAHLGNIRTEDEASGTGFFWLGTPAADGMSLEETWAEVMVYLLDNDFPFEDGRSFDLTGFDMLGAPTFEWSLEMNPKLGVILDRLAQRGSPHFDQGDPMSVIRVRRWDGVLSNPVE